MDHKMGQPLSYLIMQIQSMIDEDAIHLSHIFLFNTFFIWYFYCDCCHYSLTFRFHPMDLYFWGIFSYDIKCFSIGWMSNYSYYLWFFFTYRNAWIRYSYFLWFVFLLTIFLSLKVLALLNFAPFHFANIMFYSLPLAVLSRTNVLGGGLG